MTRSRITQNALFLFAGTLFGHISLFIFQVLIARNFGSAAYGTFSLANGVLLIVVTIALYGFPDALTKYIGEFRDSNSRLAGLIRLTAGLSVGTSLLLGGVLYLAADSIGVVVFGSKSLGQFLRLFAFALPGIVLVRLTGATLMGFEYAGYRAFTVDVVQKGTLITATGVVLMFGYPFLTLGIIYVLSYWLAALVGILLVIKIVRGKFQAKPEYNTYNVLSFSLPLLLSSQVGLISNWIDTILIGIITSSESLVGVYQSSFVLATSVLLFMGSITGSLYPNFSKLVGSDETDKLVRRYRDATKWGVFFTAPPVVYLLTFSKTSLVVIFGDKFAAGSLALGIIALGNLGGVAMGAGATFVKSVGDSRYVFVTEFGALVVNVMLNLALIPIIGISGAALGTSLATFLRNLSLFIWARRYVSLEVPIRPIGEILTASAVAVAVVYKASAEINSFGTLFIHITLFLGVHMVILYALGGFSYQDIREALQAIHP